LMFVLPVASQRSCPTRNGFDWAASVQVHHGRLEEALGLLSRFRFPNQCSGLSSAFRTAAASE
jgi:hypothetical protein